LITNRKPVFNCSIFKVDEVQIALPDGKSVTRHIVEHGEVAVIIAKLSPDEYLMVEQDRHAIGKRSLELPAGRVEKGEDNLKAAGRELAEETGYQSVSIKYLFSTYASPGFMTEKFNFYLAEDLKHAPLKPDEDEFIEVKVMSKKQLLAAISQNSIEDNKTISGLLYYFQYAGL
jgi:ADP-ribose pyrophosphatase